MQTKVTLDPKIELGANKIQWNWMFQRASWQQTSRGINLNACSLVVHCTLKVLRAKLLTFVVVTVLLFLFTFLLFSLYAISRVKSEAGYAREAWKESREEDGDAAGFQRTVTADSTIIRKTITPYQEGRYLFSYSDKISDLSLLAKVQVFSSWSAKSKSCGYSSRMMQATSETHDHFI